MDIKIQINVKNRQNSDIHVERRKIYIKISLERHRFDTYSKPKIMKISIKRNGTNWLLSIDLND